MRFLFRISTVTLYTSKDRILLKIHSNVIPFSNKVFFKVTTPSQLWSNSKASSAHRWPRCGTLPTPTATAILNPMTCTTSLRITMQTVSFRVFIDTNRFYRIPLIRHTYHICSAWSVISYLSFTFLWYGLDNMVLHGFSMIWNEEKTNKWYGIRIMRLFHDFLIYFYFKKWFWSVFLLILILLSTSITVISSNETSQQKKDLDFIE